MKQIDYDIVVVGGGLVGYAFALDLALQNSKFKIAIIDAKENIYLNLDNEVLDNRIYAISPSNVSYLKYLGAWPHESRVGTIKTMDVSGDVESNIFFERNLGRDLFLAKTVEYKILQAELYLKLKENLNVVFIYDTLSDIIDEGSYSTLVGKNTNYTSSLVVGADGANSFVRKIAGLKAEVIDYQESGVVANFICELPHNNVAYQWFSDDGILAYLPLNGNKISIVWSSKKAKELLSMLDADFADLVAKAGKHKLGQLQLITKPVAFPLRMYMLEKIYANKIVLIGDAAHTIHPLAGHGVNLGFKDSKLLAESLAKCQSYQLIDSAFLAKYNIMRQPRIRQMQLTCHFLHRLFASDVPLFKQIRNVGLNLVNHLTFLKKNLIMVAR